MAVSPLQNFYKEQIAIACGAGAENIYVSTKPVPTNGFLVISPGSESLREIIKYTGTGTDGDGDYVTVANIADRGLGGTTAQAHEVGEPIRMNYTAEHQKEIDDIIEAIVTGGTPDASTTVKGRAKLSVAPVDAADPIAVGTNDARLGLAANLITTDEKAALAGGGDFGTPSESNKFLTEEAFVPTLEGVYSAVTFPVVEATSSNQAANSSAVSQSAPSGTTAGDLLIVILRRGTSVSVEPSGYTLIGAASTHISVYTKIATGADTFTCTLDGSTNGWCTHSYRVSNYWGSVDLTNVVTTVITEAADHNPPLNNPDNIFGFYLWIAGASTSGTTGTVTGEPTGYTDGIFNNSGDGDTGQQTLGTARKSVRAIEEDPGTFAGNTAGNREQFTISVRASETYLG